MIQHRPPDLTACDDATTWRCRMLRRFALILGLAGTSFLPVFNIGAEPAPAASIGNAGTQSGPPENAADKAPYPVDHDAPLAAKERVVEKAGGYTKYHVEFNGIRSDRVPGFL